MERISNPDLIAQLEKMAAILADPALEADRAGVAELVKLAADRLAISPLAMMHAGAADVLFERQRQTEQEGWTAAHDDEHDRMQLAAAAACYISPGELDADGVPKDWPWREQVDVSGGRGDCPVWAWRPAWWKPGGKELADYRRRLVKGGALTIAEIDRVDRQIAEGK